MERSYAYVFGQEKCKWTSEWLSKHAKGAIMEILQIMEILRMASSTNRLQAMVAHAIAMMMMRIEDSKFCENMLIKILAISQ